MNVIHGMVILLLPPSLTHTRTRTHTHTPKIHILPPETVPSFSQQQIHISLSGLFLFGILKEPLCTRAFAAEGLFCLLSLAPTAATMSSTLSCWYDTSPSLRRPLTHLFGGFLADVSKNIMLWALAKLMACSWLTWPSTLRGSRRSLLFPTRNLGGVSAAESNTWGKVLTELEGFVIKPKPCGILVSSST